MESTSDKLEQEPERHHVRHRHSRIPLDTVAWVVLFFIALPLAIHAGWFRPEEKMHHAGETVLLWLGLAFGELGTLILAVVRYPLYVRRHHQGFRPRELPHNFRPTFWVSYVLITVGVLIVITLVIMQRLK
ncbi:MAG: hypothetical protein NTY53_11015 [Kiritimatiellaeota bacterium]|nr:hypothetical protein [Kiritimatiellota bacterium]